MVKEEILEDVAMECGVNTKKKFNENKDEDDLWLFVIQFEEKEEEKGVL